MMAADFGDSEILNTLVRMVIPMRREFGRQLDVRQFLRDGPYAEEVLGVALSSRDPRLAEYARYVERRLHGARVADSTPNAVAPDAATDHAETVPAAFTDVPLKLPSTAAPGVPPPQVGASDPDEVLRQRVMRKYTGGLR
jgi:hypothetical protein